MSAAPLLQVEDLSIEFGWGASAVKAVRNVSWSVAPGETLAIIGESGSGKSVSTSTILNLLPTPPARVTSGRILFDGVDLLINNAGGVLGFVGKPMEEVTAAEWQDIISVNMSAAFWFSQGVVPAMKDRGFGRIVNISSGAGLNISLTGIQAYATAKAGVIHLTRQLAHELGPFGITVNSIAPGFVRSNLNTERQWQSYGESGQRQLVEAIAMRRLGTPEDIAHGALFLASNYAGWITGQVLSIDGGK